MRFFRILGIIITILVVVYITLGFFGPTEYRVERSIKIDAPINVVFNQTTKFENWAAWSPWAAADPGAKYTFEKDEQVVGAKNSWEGEVSGTGNITITEIVKNEKMVYELNFTEPWYMAMTSIGGFDYSQKDGVVNLTWYDGGDFSFMTRPMMLFMDLEDQIGPMFEKGLENIKEVSENKKNAIEITATTVESQQILFVAESANIDTKEIGEKMGAAYGEIMALMGVAKIEMVAAPIAITQEYDVEKMTCQFKAAVPVSNLSDELVLDGRIEKGNTYAGKVLKAVHVGSYNTLQLTYSKILAHIAANGYEMNGESWEAYVDNPQEVEEAVRRTFIYFPIK